MAAFLERHRTGKANETVYLKEGRGFLKLVYDDEGALAEAAFVEKKGGPTIGLQLYFDWVNEMHAFKTPHGLSGHQWVNGVVVMGTVYDDDGPPDPGREIDLDAWIDECLAKMVQPA